MYQSVTDLYISLVERDRNQDHKLKRPKPLIDCLHTDVVADTKIGG
jgi:hypothetical protein